MLFLLPHVLNNSFFVAFIVVVVLTGRCTIFLRSTIPTIFTLQLKSSLIRDDIGVNNHDHTMCNWEIFSYKFDSTKFKAEYKV